jgi:hypothetical protein
MTIGRILGFIAGTILVGVGAKFGELLFLKVDKKFKEKMKEWKEESEAEIKKAVDGAEVQNA